MADTVVKRAMLKITADDGDTQEKLDRITEKADELARQHPDLKLKIDTGAASAKLAVLKRELNDTAKDAGDSGDKGGKSFGDRFRQAVDDDLAGNLISHALGSSGGESGGGKAGSDEGGLFASNFTQTILGGKKATIIGGVSTVMAALPALGGIAGVGAGVGMIGGLAGELLAHDSKVKSAASKMGTSVMGTLEKTIQPLVPIVTKIFGQVDTLMKQVAPELTSVFKEIGPQIEPIFRNVAGVVKDLVAVMKAAAPAFGPFIGGLLDLVKNILPPLTQGIKATVPFIGQFGMTLGTLGKDLGSVFDSAAPAIKASMTVLGALLRLIGGILPPVMKLAGVLAQVLAPVVRGLAGVFRGLEPAITAIARAVGGFAEAFIANLGGGLKAIFAVLRATEPALMDLAKALQRVFNLANNTGVFNDIEDAFEGLVKPAGKLIDALVKGLVPVLPAVVRLLGAVAGALQKGLISAVTALVKAFTPLIPVISKVAVVIADLMASGVAKLTPVLTAVAPLIAGVVLAMKAWAVVNGLVVGAMKLLGIATEENIGKITAMGIAEKLQAMWEGIVAIATRAWAAVQGVLDAVMDASPVILIVAAIGLLVVAIVELVKHWHTVADVAKTVFGDVEDTVRHAVDDIRQWVTDGWRAVEDVFRTVLGTIEGCVQSEVQGVKNILSWFAGLGGLFRGWWDDAVSAVESAAARIWDFAKSLPGKILHALGDLGHLLVSAGGDLIRGLVHGITSAVGGLLSTVGHIAGDVSHAFASVLHILSPSKVFEQHGQMIVAGLVAGIREAGPQAETAARRLASATSGAFRGSPAAGAGGAGGGAPELVLRAEGSGPMAEFMRAALPYLRAEIRAGAGGGPDSVQRFLGQAWR